MLYNITLKLLHSCQERVTELLIPTKVKGWQRVLQCVVTLWLGLRVTALRVSSVITNNICWLSMPLHYTKYSNYHIVSSSSINLSRRIFQSQMWAWESLQSAHCAVTTQQSISDLLFPAEEINMLPIFILWFPNFHVSRCFFDDMIR